MARMLGVCGMTGSGCSPRCKRTHKPKPKRNHRAQRSYEKRQWHKTLIDAIEEVIDVLTP